MGLKSVHSRLLLISLHYSMTKRITVDGPEVCTQPFTVDESTLQYDKACLLSMGLKSVHSRLLLISLHYSMTKRVTVDGPEVCTQPFTVDESTLQYDKACLLSMGLKSVHSRLLLISLHYSMTKRVTVDGPEVCTQPFTVD